MTEKINPSLECSRYQKCSVNNCPLHPQYPNLLIDIEDKEQKCTMEKQVRHKIGSKYADILTYQGLTTREWTSKKRYENLSEDEKQKMKDRLEEFKFKKQSP